MAVWGEIQHKGDITDIKQVMNYVYQLEEQVHRFGGSAINQIQVNGIRNRCHQFADETAVFVQILRCEDRLDGLINREQMFVRCDWAIYHTGRESCQSPFL